VKENSKNISSSTPKGKSTLFASNRMFSEALKSSRGYNGKGQAIYTNGDIYKGDFVEGVRILTVFKDVDLTFAFEFYYNIGQTRKWRIHLHEQAARW